MVKDVIRELKNENKQEQKEVREFEYLHDASFAFGLASLVLLINFYVFGVPIIIFIFTIILYITSLLFHLDYTINIRKIHKKYVPINV